MAPNSKIYIIRHAQGLHNVDGDTSIRDPRLTNLGRQQSSEAGRKLASIQHRIQLVLTSPMARTLETSQLAFGSAIERLGKEKVICLPQFQEISSYQCDTGSEKEKLESLEEFAAFDFSSLTPEWILKEGKYATTHEALKERAKWVCQYLYDRPEEHIAVISHGHFIMLMLDDKQWSKKHWENAECRVCEFKAGENSSYPLRDVFALASGATGASVPRASL